MKKLLYLAIMTLFVSCVTQKTQEKHVEQWAYMDGIYVDHIDTLYDPVSNSMRLASIVGQDTIWDFNSTRLYINTDSGLYWIDKNGKHRF